MKQLTCFLGVLLIACCFARGAMPDVLPYGITELPVPPSPLKNETDPRVVDLLGGQLSNPDPLQRVRLLAEIGACKLPGGATYVKQAMTDADPLVRAQAALAAAGIGDKALLEDLKPLAKDADPRVRIAVMQAAGALGGDGLVATGLQDGDAAVVTAAITAALAGNADAIAAAMGKYPPATQLVAIRSLGRLAAASHAAVVAPFLSNEAIWMRSAAAEAIGWMKATTHTDTVDKLLADKHATVRRSALVAMANLTSAAEFQKRAIKALGDPDLSVRQASADLLIKFPTPDAIEALAGNLASESTRLHKSARDALVAIGQPSVSRAEQLLADAEPHRREDGSFILGRLKSDASLEKHIALLADQSWLVVRQAADSLGRIGRKEAVPELVRLANLAPAAAPATIEPTALVDYFASIENAIVACAYFDERSIVDVCRKVLPGKEKFPSSVRGAAAYAMGRMDVATGPGPGMFNRILNDQEDSGDVKTESLKAFGHMKAPAGKSWVGTDRSNSKISGDKVSDWLAYWVRWKLTGKDVDYDPLPDVWQAPVSIHVLP